MKRSNEQYEQEKKNREQLFNIKSHLTWRGDEPGWQTDLNVHIVLVPNNR